MHLVTVQSAKAGSGSTTVVANLGAAVRQASRPVLLIELCPSNLLRLFFGAAWAESSGLCQQLAAHAHWYEATRRSACGVDFVSYGSCAQLGETETAMQLQAAGQGGILDSLTELDLPQNLLVILDLPHAGSSRYQTLLQAADLQLLVVTADPACFARLRAANERYADAHLLINRFDPNMVLEHDLSTVIKADHAKRMVPVSIHRDEALREALAYKQTVISCAPHSQSTHDFSKLAVWLNARLNRGVG